MNKKILNINLIRVFSVMVMGTLMLLCSSCTLFDNTAKNREETTLVANKQGDGIIRHDLEPIISRFPVFSNAVSSMWLSGTIRDDRVPGPSTYWIDAVIVLPHAEHEKLKKFATDINLNSVQYDRNELPFDFVPKLLEYIPNERLYGSDVLLKFCVTEKYGPSNVLVVDDGKTIIFTAIFS